MRITGTLSVCRLCMCLNDSYINIFQENDNIGCSAARLIADLLQLDASESDRYPSIICKLCFSKLEEFKDFKESCIQTKVFFDDEFENKQTSLISAQEREVEPDFAEFPSDHNINVDDLDAWGNKIIKDERSTFQRHVAAPHLKNSIPEIKEEVEINEPIFENPVVSSRVPVVGNPSISLIFHEGGANRNSEEISDSTSLPLESSVHNEESIYAEQRRTMVVAMEDVGACSSRNVDYSIQPSTSAMYLSPSKNGPFIGGLGSCNESCGADILGNSLMQKSSHPVASRGTFGDGPSPHVTCIQPTNPNIHPIESVHPEMRNNIFGNTVLEQVPRKKSRKESNKRKNSDTTLVKPSTQDGKTGSKRYERSNLIHEFKNTGLNPKKIPYICDNCGFTTLWKSTLIEHVRIHIGERPHKCNICPKDFTTLYSLRIHIKTHLGERNFSCDICSKKFVTKSLLKFHKKMHRQEWTCSCEVCGKGFMTPSLLQRHRVKHTGIKSFRCNQCDRFFSRKYTLKKHMDLHAITRPRYYCEKCKKSYLHRRSIKMHTCKV